MRWFEKIGAISKTIGWIVFISSGVWGVHLCLSLILQNFGFLASVAAFIVSPITFVIFPLYSGFFLDDWLPIILNYGGGFFGVILVTIGSVLDEKSHDGVRLSPMAQVGWAPKGYSAPLELIAVRIKQGPVTEQDWWEALTDRVQELAEKAGEKETAKACRILDVPQPEELCQAGQSLVQHNLNLRTHLDLAIFDESPWPATVTENDPEIQEILEGQTLMDWVDHAWSLVSPSSLD